MTVFIVSLVLIIVGIAVILAVRSVVKNETELNKNVIIDGLKKDL